MGFLLCKYISTCLFFFNYFDNNHDVNVGNKKGARYAPGMENISHALNKLGML